MKTKKIKQGTLKHIPTKRIKSILENCNGLEKDYSHDYIQDDLKAVLYSREVVEIEKFIDRYEKELLEYESFLDSEGVPPIPAEYFENYFNKVG